MPTPTTAEQREAMEAHLEDMLAETEETATRLRKQLAELRAQPVPSSSEDDEDKHEAINSLFDNLEETQVQWGKVRAFFELAVHELFGHRNGQASSPTTDAPSPDDSHLEGEN